MPRSDFAASFHGSVVIIRALTTAARQFVTEQVEVPSWAWMGAATFAADRRPAQELLCALDDQGFTVTLN